MRGNHGDGGVGGVERAEGVDGDLFVWRFGGGRHGGVGAVAAAGSDIFGGSARGGDGGCDEAAQRESRGDTL